ncbi:MAG: iron ABC transporter permease [Clostridiales bacterium]
MQTLSPGRTTLTVALLVLILAALFIVSFLMGRFDISLGQVYRVLSSHLLRQECAEPDIVKSVVLKVRTPRIFAAILIGGALAVSGAVYQGLFKNPMVSPDIMGASSGAGFGAALAILMSFSFTGIQITSFIFGILAVVLAYSICTAVSQGKDSILILVLSGMVISTLFSSFITLSKFVADPYSKLPEITYWLMGTLSATTSADVRVLIIPLLIGFVPLFLLRWRLNAMAFGDEEAQAMGLNTKRLRIIFIATSTLLTAACVAIAGMIGWVGLIIPHFSRMIVGPNYKTLLPVSFLIGGIFMLGVDNIARTAFSMEIPLGILTSIIGAPFFVYLLFKRKKNSA